MKTCAFRLRGDKSPVEFTEHTVLDDELTTVKALLVRLVHDMLPVLSMAHVLVTALGQDLIDRDFACSARRDTIPSLETDVTIPLVLLPTVNGVSSALAVADVAVRGPVNTGPATVVPEFPTEVEVVCC